MNELLLAALTDMGFDPPASAAALRATGNRNVEAAVLWLCGPDTEGAQPSSSASEPVAVGVPTTGGEAVGVPSSAALTHIVHPSGETSPAWVRTIEGDFKVVLVVCTALGMSAGKIGAQCAHAAVGLLKLMQRTVVPWLPVWEAHGEKTVVLKVETASQMDALRRKAEDLGLPVHLVLDAGRTEVAPGSATVLALGGPSDTVDSVTGHLRTL